MGGGEGGKEGDWECSRCENRNYAFRSFCNRCKQPRLLVDSKTPADSKWLPRIGDWICTGCTNNNYASREKCKKCGQPKELAAMPALAMPGTSLQTHPHYFARVQGLQHQRLNGVLQQPIPLSPNWLLGVTDKFGVTASNWPMGPTNTVPYANQVSQVPKGWRNGDWICICGFHNYSSRAQCKKCDASMPPALGTKRLASEDLAQDWDNKRLNAGQTLGLQQAYLPLGQISSSTFLTPFQMVNSATNQTAGLLQLYPDGSPRGQNNGVMEIGCAQTVTITTMHLDPIAISVIHKGRTCSPHKCCIGEYVQLASHGRLGSRFLQIFVNCLVVYSAKKGVYVES